MAEKYFVIEVSKMNSTDWTEWKRSPGNQRYSIDGTQVVVDYDDSKDLKFRGAHKIYTRDQIEILMETPEWKNIDPLRPELSKVSAADFNTAIAQGLTIKDLLGK